MTQMKTVLFVFEDLPVKNGNGYSTYNRAFLSCINKEKYEVRLIITGSNHKSYLYNPESVLGLDVTSIKVINSLFSTSRICIPSVKGLLKILYRKFFKKHLGAIGNSQVKIGRWLSKKEAALLRNEIVNVKPDFVFVDTIFRSFDLGALPTNLKTILIGHDVFFERCKSMLENGLSPSPMITPELEFNLAAQYNHIVAITEHDATIYREHGMKSVHAISSPIIRRDFIPRKSATKNLFYLGSRAHHNVNGLQWFLDNVWTLIQARDPQVTLFVVGSVCELIPETYANVRLLGMLDNFSEICDASAIAINPVLSGSGMKIKTLDYLANGLPCLTTELGAEGFRLAHEDGPILIANDSEDFCNQLLALLNDTEKLNYLSSEALKFADYFSIDGFKEKLEKIL